MAVSRPGPAEVEGKLLDRLREDGRTSEWLDSLPAPDAMAEALVDLAVPHEDIDPLIAMTPDAHRHPEVWWLIERAAASLHAHFGQIDGPRMFPTLARPGDVFLRYFYVYVFLALKPAIEEWHRERGIPADVSRRSLADLGRTMAVHRKRHGEGGLGIMHWPMYHFRGALYQLGRLQFQRGRLGETTGTAIHRHMPEFGPGTPVLGVHITDFGGPMSPDVCDRSIAQARKFFPRHFPEERYAVADCHSWLLDPQLADYLPPTSNVIRFQRRFRLVERTLEPNDDSTFLFVFGRPASEIDSLPRETSVQRALIDHVRAGGHWYGGSGWMLLDE